MCCVYEGIVDTQRGKQRLSAYAESILPDKEPWVISEGLIELGATLCTKRPQCIPCPLRESCLAYRHHLQETLPRKRQPHPITLLERVVGVVLCRGHYLLRKGEEGKVMADLYEFPYYEGVEISEEDAESQFEKILGFPSRCLKSLPRQHHSFTRYRVKLYPYLMESESLHAPHENYFWKRVDEIALLPFSSGHRKILSQICERDEDFTY
jgi:A/G-specific adenine glycosylase